MFIRIALTTILLAICNVHTCRAKITWVTTCPINIPETSPKGALMTLNATGANNFTLLNQNVTDRFMINSSSGVLSSTTDLDYEGNLTTYFVQIMASNAADPSDNLTCEIRITDVNDEKPLFDEDTYYVATVNNVAINTSLLTVSATDKDVTAEFNKVVYNIKDGSANFTMNATTGVISAKTVLAAAAPLNLTLTVVAIDKHKTTLTAEVPVTVCLGCKTSLGISGSTGSPDSSGSSAQGITLFASMALLTSVVLI